MDWINPANYGPDLSKPCGSCGAVAGAACTTRTGKLYERGHADRRAEREAQFKAAMKNWRAERDAEHHAHDAATKPTGPPPLFMQVLDASSGKIMRFFPALGPKRRFRRR